MTLPARSLALKRPATALPSTGRASRTAPPAVSPPLNPWLQLRPGTPQIVQGATDFAALLEDAGEWADEITLCLNAPKAGSRELLGDTQISSWSVKSPQIYLRSPDFTDGPLLRALHEAGITSWVEGGGKLVARQLLLFVRRGQARVLFSHLPLERAISGAAFGTLLSFTGATNSDFVRACLAQVESCAQRSTLPMGSDVDRLLADRQRLLAPPPAELVRAVPEEHEEEHERIVSEHAPLGQCLHEWLQPLVSPASASPGEASPDVDSTREALLELQLGSGWTLGLRSAPGGFRLRLHRQNGESFALHLYSGEAWAAGDCLMMKGPEGALRLIWRGGLLGHSAWKQETLWRETRLSSSRLDDRGLAQRVASIATDTEPLAPQLLFFADELQRLATVFSADTPPALGHTLADFSALSSRQQAQMAWSALIGLGALTLEQAVELVAQAMRNQGSLRFEGALPNSELCASLRGLLHAEVERNLRFDRPTPETVRAIQPDFDAYLEDDWLRCALQSLPQTGSVDRNTAVALTFQSAEQTLGIFGLTLRAGSLLERTIDSALTSGVQRGLLARVGAGSLGRIAGNSLILAEKPTPHCPNLAVGASFSSGWSHQLSQLAPLQRLVVTSREGWSGKTESRLQLAERLSVQPERVDELEIEAWAVLEQTEPFRQYLQQRLEQNLGTANFVPVPLLLKEDPWWRGVEEHLLALPQAFERLLKGSFHWVRLPSRLAGADANGPSGMAISRLSQRELDTQLGAPPPLERTAAEQCSATSSVPGTRGATSEARLRLQDAVLSTFRIAREPLTFPPLLKGARQRIEVEELELQAALCEPPFVQLDDARYGLLSKDVPGGQATIACVLQEAHRQLNSTRRALTPEQLSELALRHFSSTEFTPLVSCLLRSDPSLHSAASGHVTPAHWQGVCLIETAEPLRLALPAQCLAQFESLALSDTPDLEDALRRANFRLRCLEQDATADDVLPLCEARYLVTRFARLASSHNRRMHGRTERDAAIALRLSRAAIGCFYENDGEEDEDDIDRRPLVQPQQLAQCRCVLEAVLAYFDDDQ